MLIVCTMTLDITSGSYPQGLFTKLNQDPNDGASSPLLDSGSKRNVSWLFLEGETGLLVSKITNIAPFVGYAQNEEQTERKKLRNVLKKGDLYFNSGDLMRIDNNNFIYFQDRVGDTFRYRATVI